MKKVAASNRPQKRKQEALRRKLQTREKQVATAQRKVREYTERIEALEQEAQQKQAENQAEVAALRRASRAATTPKQREPLGVRAERLAAKDQVQQVRFQERRHRLIAHRRTWQQKLEARQGKREKVAQTLQELEDRPFYDFDLEKDDLMTYLRMAGENAHCFAQEQYFAGTLLEKVDEATMAWPGWFTTSRAGYGDRASTYTCCCRATATLKCRQPWPRPANGSTRPKSNCPVVTSSTWRRRLRF